MQPHTLAVSFCFVLLLSASAPSRAALVTPTVHPPQVPVEVAAVRLYTEGAYVLVVLTYHNPTDTPQKIGLQQWANAHTLLRDDVRNSYTLLQTTGIGYGADVRYWLALDAHGGATASFLFRVDYPADQRPARYTFTSGQRMLSDAVQQFTTFTLSLPDIVPYQSLPQ